MKVVSLVQERLNWNGHAVYRLLIGALVSTSEWSSDHRANTLIHIHSTLCHKMISLCSYLKGNVRELAESHMQCISIIEP